MSTFNRIGLLWSFSLLFLSPSAFAQQDITSDQETLQQDVALLADTSPRVAEQAHPGFSQAELDQMLAPIALYHDSLLSQILMASTYPLEVVEAARWSKAHPELNGEEAVEAVSQYQWDPSVKSLVAFPQILATMDEKLGWMQRLGEAFLSQQQQVMESIQKLRQAAAAAGNLESNEQILVEQQDNSIVIQPASPQIVYVPYYDPLVIYGTWWWPAYRPVYWAPWPSYLVTPVASFKAGFYWGFGVPIGPRCWFGAFNWPYRNVMYSSGVVWVHSPIHRRAVPYRNFALQQTFGSVRTSPVIPPQFRSSLSTPYAWHGGNGSGQQALPHEQFGVRPGGQGNGQSHFMTPRGHHSDFQAVPGQPNRSWGGRSPHQQRMPAMSHNVRPSIPQRHFSSPGLSGFQHAAPRIHGGGVRGGDSSGGHGGGGHGGHRR